MSGKRTFHVALLAAFGLAGAAMASAETPAVSVDALTRQAQLIFEGTVTRADAANVSAVKAGPDTAVVRIDEILRAPGAIGKFAGHEVTVKIGAPVKAGDRAVFFTREWLYGESLALIEVGRTAPGAAVRAEVAATRRLMDDEDLQGRLDRAVVIVAGRVVATRPAAGREKHGHSEHDALWREAVIAVDRVLKGTAGAESRVVFLYPASHDVAWFGAPKPEVGWDGVWLLEKSPLFPDALAMASPLSLMPRESLAAVAKKVKP